MMKVQNLFFFDFRFDFMSFFSRITLYASQAKRHVQVNVFLFHQNLFSFFVYAIVKQ